MFDLLMQTVADPDMISNVLQSAPDTGEVTELLGNVVDFVKNTV
jgi:hypothetical protein